MKVEVRAGAGSCYHILPVHCVGKSTVLTALWTLTASILNLPFETIGVKKQDFHTFTRC